MFVFGEKIKYLDLQYFNTSSVTNMGFMFYGCISLESLNLGNMDTSSVTNMEYMFDNCYSLTSIKIEELNLSKLENTEHMFYHCGSLKYINLTNFDSNITLSTGMFSNPNLIYCIDDNKEYQILPELKNYTKNCGEMCTKHYSKKYIKESNLCIDSCSTEIIYKYDYNNYCLENCPNNTVLDNDTFTCNSIEDIGKNDTGFNINSTNNNNTSNKIFIIIISIVGGVLILGGIFFFIIRICRRKVINNNDQITSLEHENRTEINSQNVETNRELQNISTGEDEQEKIKIIFNFNQEKTEIYKNRQTSFKNLITSYLKRKQFQNKQELVFVFDANSMSYEEAINNDRKLGEFIPDNENEKEFLVYDWSNFGSKSTINVIA